jgi:outer membrane protein insertion porin family
MPSGNAAQTPAYYGFIEAENPESADSRLRFVPALGNYAPPPSALRGPFQPRPTSAGIDEDTGLAIPGRLQLQNLGGEGQNLTLNVKLGERVINGELSFVDLPREDQPTGFAVNLFNQRSVQTVFNGGDDVDLPNGETPLVHRLGGGVAALQAVTPDLTVAAGVTYQRVSIRDEAFTNELQPVDQLGNALTYSGTGQDDLLTVNLAAELDERNDRTDPTRGARVRLGVDQSIPIGAASIAYTRLSGSYTQFLPLRLFQLAEGEPTLVVRVEGGTMIGDVPPYEAFDIGSGTVRGFSEGVGTGRSFAAASTEYRFPIANFQLFRDPVRLGGTLFADYGTDLGSGDTILGEPGEVRNKPGSGFGYGAGLRARTAIGTIRLEFAWTDQGENELTLDLGDRF